MPVLQPHRPLGSTTPRLVVHNALPPGRHRFALVVVDDRGRASAPDICVVTVRPRERGVTSAAGALKP